MPQGVIFCPPATDANLFLYCLLLLQEEPQACAERHVRNKGRHRCRCAADAALKQVPA
jgi:hypothetical protein